MVSHRYTSWRVSFQNEPKLNIFPQSSFKFDCLVEKTWRSSWSSSNGEKSRVLSGQNGSHTGCQSAAAGEIWPGLQKQVCYDLIFTYTVFTCLTWTKQEQRLLQKKEELVMSSGLVEGMDIAGNCCGSEEGGVEDDPAEKRRLLDEAAEKRRLEGESRGSGDQKGSKRRPGRMLQGGGMRWQVRWTWVKRWLPSSCGVFWQPKSKKPGIDIFHSIQTMNSSHTTDPLQKGSAQNKKGEQLMYKTNIYVSCTSANKHRFDRKMLFHFCLLKETWNKMYLLYFLTF